jgi:hypothetical protein
LSRSRISRRVSGKLERADVSVSVVIPFSISESRKK